MNNEETDLNEFEKCYNDASKKINQFWLLYGYPFVKKEKKKNER